MFTRIALLAHIAKWRLTWKRGDTLKAYAVPGNPKFMSARDAAVLIRDGDVVAFSGLGGNQRASIMFWAIRQRFEETGSPRDLTLMAIGGIGSRGRAPGTLEELGQSGLARRFFTGHFETFKAMLRLADAGQMELQCLPQGTMALLIDAQGRGEDSIVSRTGVGTFIDPRVGRGTPVDDEVGEQWVSAEGDSLRYRMPKIHVAVFNLPAADRKGNLYAKNCAIIGESLHIAKAAKRNGGVVIANVGLVVDEGYDEIVLPGDMVDAVVVFSGTEQVGSVPHRKYWPLFTTHSDISASEGIKRLKYVNWILGYTPRRRSVDEALARLATSLFAEHEFEGALVNIGIGLPEEVCRLLAKAGLVDHLTLFTESGVVGGIPAPGVFFGAAVAPREITTSVEVFQRCYRRLDVSILGVLQADSDGNVNVSKRGEGAINYVGPGGFMDFTTAASTIYFVSSWMAGGRIEMAGDRVRVVERGRPKFVQAVDEITFNGRQALALGKRVFFITHVGVFRLTEGGMELMKVMPGIDIQKDILDVASMRVVLPESGEVPVVDASVVTGEGFRLALRPRAD
ncbi:MAG TPA: CoA-transferase [Candidatus Hydrogenedentes bacterium]|nr:CoA-transferase [Candidatus Hydrogenedentota bacterium]